MCCLMIRPMIGRIYPLSKERKGATERPRGWEGGLKWLNNGTTSVDNPGKACYGLRSALTHEVPIV